MTDIVRYIISFLLDENTVDDISRFIGYTSSPGSFSDYKIVIIPSGFFDDEIYGTYLSHPSLPVKELEGMPFIYGKSAMERVGDTIVIYADLIASTYFLISRYEEFLNRNMRDEYGRFVGHESLPYRAGFINRPVVDEYGIFLRGLLNQCGVKTKTNDHSIRMINLTHDVDIPFSCRSWRNVVREIVSGHNPLKALNDKYGSLEKDPFYTFPEMFDYANKLVGTFSEDKCRSLVFFKAGGNTKVDKPVYDLFSKDIQSLYAICKKNNVKVGLHSSYEASLDPTHIKYEKQNLEDAFEITIDINRHHFLASREPEDMLYLESAGIKDDYTMGYADVAGFRLGTSRPVRYINPVDCTLHSLILHPLTIMDGSLNEEKYMNLSYREALDYSWLLIENIRKVNGELTLLWHNTSTVKDDSYLRDLYYDILDRLNTIR
jgi:hypothetical protein